MWFEEVNQWFTGSVAQCFIDGSGLLIDRRSQSVVHRVSGSVGQWGSD